MPTSSTAGASGRPPRALAAPALRDNRQRTRASARVSRRGLEVFEIGKGRFSLGAEGCPNEADAAGTHDLLPERCAGRVVQNDDCVSVGVDRAEAFAVVEHLAEAKAELSDGDRRLDLDHDPATVLLGHKVGHNPHRGTGRSYDVSHCSVSCWSRWWARVVRSSASMSKTPVRGACRRTSPNRTTRDGLVERRAPAYRRL